ncbi:MAG: isoprenylcysteine carboxylmethyltransferase family protein [Ketobacter sp.]|nr:MAG: isoprenylcysteine carboxylmethyltransferase family protein [Ketobacter sp.]
MKVLENKIPPPLIATVCGLFMWVLSLATPAIEITITVRVIAVTLALLTGMMFCLAGVLSFKRAKTTVNPLKPQSASALVDSGVYRITRNPMYVGFALGLLAWSFYLASPWTLTGIFVFIVYMNRFQIEPEERALLSLFGAEYSQYQARARRWL